jgi:uncharacterized protein (DUF1697 family)
MQRYVAFLRAINVGNRRVPMGVLKQLFEDIGFAQVETFIASGNVIFSSDSPPSESKIATHLEKSLGYDVDTFVRTAEEVISVSKTQPFFEEGQENITVHIGFLHQALTPEIAERFANVSTNDDEFRIVGREYYYLCRIKVSDSKIWVHPEIKVLKLPVSTMRNRTSLQKLIDKHLSEN